MLFSLACLSLFVSTASNAHGWKTPEEAINAYIKAVKTGSGHHVEMAFTESASIQYYNQDGKFLKYSRDEFAKLVDQSSDWDAKIEITDLKKTGNVANATVEFTWSENGEKGYVDYLNLLFDDKKSWHITDKVAQFVDRN